MENKLGLIARLGIVTAVLGTSAGCVPIMRILPHLVNTEYVSYKSTGRFPLEEYQIRYTETKEEIKPN